MERKLSQMILDRTLSGILEQGKGHLVIYDSAPEDSSYSKAVEIIANMGDAVSALSSRAKNVSASNSTTASASKDGAVATEKKKDGEKSADSKK